MFALLQRNTSSPSGALRLLRVLLDVKCLTNVEFHSPRATGVSVVSRSSSIRIRLPSKHNEISMFSHQQVSNSLLNHWSINCTNVILQNHLEIDQLKIEQRSTIVVNDEIEKLWKSGADRFGPRKPRINYRLMNFPQVTDEYLQIFASNSLA